jgi:DNA-binding transcriptional regulator YhcF (GntR family)
MAISGDPNQAGHGARRKRPFLRLGVSQGFTYTYDPGAAEGERITGMWLHGEPVGADTSYEVTVNSFLAAGGDNFRAFAKGTDRADTGMTDLQAMVDYMAQFDEDNPLEVDVERDSDVPISTQIYWQLAYQIDSGRLLPGARLAPVRELGAALRVNPNTIRAVYRRLAPALVTLAIGLFSAVTTLAILRIVTQFAEISTFAANVGLILGIGLGVDYGLFMVYRFREELRRHPDVADAVRATVSGAGRTVAFSGATVAASLAVLFAFPFPFLSSFAYGGIAVVLTAVLGATVVRPPARTRLRPPARSV